MDVATKDLFLHVANNSRTQLVSKLLAASPDHVVKIMDEASLRTADSVPCTSTLLSERTPFRPAVVGPVIEPAAKYPSSMPHLPTNARSILLSQTTAGESQGESPKRSIDQAGGGRDVTDWITASVQWS